jgi:hypothetical protein
MTLTSRATRAVRLPAVDRQPGRGDPRGGRRAHVERRLAIGGRAI